VDIDQYKSQSVFVTGAVRTPLKVEMQGTLTLMAALVQAGSPTSEAGDEIQISHSKGTNASGAPTPDPTDADVRHVKLKDLNLGSGNIALQDGDIVFVPPARHFTMSGLVRNSGSYVWEADMTVEKAIARAGGLLDRGSTRGIQARRLVDGKMKDVDLNMQSPVLPDDVITIRQRFF
jgi:protein involved in polysaccharide export with SLBB domain